MKEQNTSPKQTVTRRRNQHGYRRYSKEDVLREAELYLAGKSIPDISKELKTPFQTVSWHLMHPLRNYDYSAWIVIRNQLLHRAKNMKRKEQEQSEIQLYLNLEEA